MKLYKLKVQLKGIKKPPVWREILVPSTFSFDLLHYVIQISMGWNNSHLHHFIVGKSRQEQVFIGVPDDTGFSFIETLDEERIELSKYIKKVNDKILYEYDFGDSWMHEITLKEIVEPDNNQKVPFILKGKGACPPEDCGGPWGYEEIKEVLQNPKHEDYEDYMEWYGPLDPQEFDLDEANSDLYEYLLKPIFDTMGDEREPDNVMVNVSHTPSSKWDKKQQELALVEFDEIFDVAFPVISPYDTHEDFREKAVACIKEIMEYNPAVVNISGELTFSTLVVFLLREVGVPCMSAVYDQQVSMIKGKKQIKNKFVQFRPFPF